MVPSQRNLCSSFDLDESHFVAESYYDLLL